MSVGNKSLVVMRKIFFVCFWGIFTFAFAVFAQTLEQETSNDIKCNIKNDILEEIIIENMNEVRSVNVKPVANKIVAPAEYNSITDRYEPFLLTTNNSSFLERSFSYGNEKKFRGSKFGVKYDNTVSQENFEQIRTLFYEYQKKKFLFNVAYKSNSFDLINKNNNSFLSFAQKYKFSDNCSLKYVYSAGKIEKHSDLLLSLTPFKNNKINFDIGAGQKFFTDNSPVRSQLIFSTEFNF